MNLLTKSILILIAIFLMIFLSLQFTSSGDGFLSKFISSEESEEHDDDEEESNVIVVDGFKALKLEEETVLISGVVTEKAEKILHKLESIAYAEVVDVLPLVSLKTEFEAALAEQHILISDLHSHNKILERAEALHKAKSLSSRDLDKSRADRDLKSSQLRAINTQLGSIKYKVKSQWGDELAEYLLDENKRSDFDLLASNKIKLILLSMPKNKALDYQKQKVYISSVNDRKAAEEASYLDKANRVNNPLYGESYYYLLDSEKIRTGMKLFSWVDEDSNEIEGLFIPDSAVIWYANQAWVYVQQDEELFLRKPLGNAVKIDKGWLLEDTALVGDKPIVTQGGQTLLSEEFKWAIPDEDDD